MSLVSNPLFLGSIAGPWFALFVPVAIKSSLLLGLLLLVSRLMRPASASARYLLWALGMISLLALPVLEAGLPSWHVIPVPALNRGTQALPLEIGVREAGMPAPSAVAAAEAEAYASIPVVMSGESVDQCVRSEHLTATAPRPLVLGGGTFRVLREDLGTMPATLWCFSIWLSGMLPLGIAFLWGIWRLRRFQCEARPLTDDGWIVLARSLSRDLGLSTPPTLLISPHALIPMTWGLRHAVVLLPKDCRCWGTDLRRQVLLHELAHVRRHDCLIQLAVRFICILYWFNPLVWVAARRIRIERERSCDDLVLMAGALPSAYASHLLHIACHLATPRRAVSTALAMANRSSMFDRLDAVLDPRRRRLAPGRPLVAAATTLTLAIVTGFSTLGLDAQAAEPQSTRPNSGSELHASALTHLPSLAPLAALAPSGSDLQVSGRRISCTCKKNGVQLKLEQDGRIRFDETYTSIARMDDDAHFMIEERKGRRTIKLQAKAGDDGRPLYEYKVGRETKPFDEEAAEWLARSLQAVLLEIGISAETRVRKAYEQGGSQGVLALIEQVDSDFSKGICYSEFFALDSLRDDEIVDVLEHLPGDIDSDYELATTLITYVDRHLARESTRASFLKCMSSMGSDHERSRVLQSGLIRDDLTQAEVAILLEAARRMDSDYQAAQAFAAINSGLLADQEMRRIYFEALERIKSEHEKAEVLSVLARHACRDAKLREACLEAAERLDSIYEYSRVMRALR
jgi:beta-lactamase regulating signal transducer with metallopeptidase domain